MVLGLLALQGVVGGVQWALKLPSEIVWVHVAIATANWLAMLWTVAAAGRLEPRDGGSRQSIERPRALGGLAAGASGCSPSRSRSASSASSRRCWSRRRGPPLSPLLGRLRSRWWALALPLRSAS